MMGRTPFSPTSFSRTSNGLWHTVFSFEQMNIEHQTYYHATPSKHPLHLILSPPTGQYSSVARSSTKTYPFFSRVNIASRFPLNFSFKDSSPLCAQVYYTMCSKLLFCLLLCIIWPLNKCKYCKGNESDKRRKFFYPLLFKFFECNSGSRGLA